MNYIHDADGNIVSRSKNQAGIRQAVGKQLVRAVDVSKTDNGGQLSIWFENGDTCVLDFASYRVMASVLRLWRNLYGVQLTIQGGTTAGEVRYDNDYLVNIEKTGDHHHSA